MRYLLLGLVFGVSLWACGLEREVEIELPAYEAQVVVEAYLEPGNRYNLLLTRGTPFFDPFDIQSLETVLEEVLEQEADVRIRYGNQEISLVNNLYYNPSTQQFANYVAQEIVPYDYTAEFNLEIMLQNGKEIDATTYLLKPIPFDSLVVEYQDDTLARVLTYLTDIPREENFYRRMLSVGSLDSVPEQDFLVEDILTDNGVIAFGTGFDYTKGDKVINSLWHISKEYYDFLESVQFSIQANLDPITQPGMIISNVNGSANPLGIFTGISLSRDTTNIE